jgi:hypothetical protein
MKTPTRLPKRFMAWVAEAEGTKADLMRLLFLPVLLFSIVFDPEVKVKALTYGP